MEWKLKAAELFDLSRTIAAPLFDDGNGYPWEKLKEISAFILALGKTLPAERFDHPAENVWIAKSASVAPTAFLGGPLIVDEEAEIRHCAFIRGSAIVGRGATVGNSTELKNCILFDGAQVPHYNYVGDSILGYKAHMGAGAVTSNVKGDKKNVVAQKAAFRHRHGYARFGRYACGRDVRGALLRRRGRIPAGRGAHAGGRVSGGKI